MFKINNIGLLKEISYNPEKSLLNIISRLNQHFHYTNKF